MFEDWDWMLIIGMVQLGINQGGMSYLNPKLGVPLWSLALLSVRTFDCSGDIAWHKKYCDGQLLPPKQSEFHFLQKR